MKNYTDDPQLRTLREVISDPKNKLNKIKFSKGALYKDSIHIHPTNDSIEKKIYFAFVRASAPPSPSSSPFQPPFPSLAFSRKNQ